MPSRPGRPNAPGGQAAGASGDQSHCFLIDRPAPKLSPADDAPEGFDPAANVGKVRLAG
jgi:hypothetical protein